MEWADASGSSNIARFGYEVSNSVLVVEFLNGGTYQYFDVPEEIYRRMCSASSKGQFLAQEIKGSYRYARM